ncbi:unnamed protein product [Brachionus calyciflorus]|uniref:Uncharacterized protein n=1 Tax=Brachionus calyciflorus TaxID=104777 RepID=A0A813XZG4_9BILA|nr:unnamed protein product [Brachionus calyciflorus]
MNSEYGIEKMPNLDELNNSKLKTTFVVDISNYKKNKIPISMSSRQNYFSTIYVNCTKNLGEKDIKMVISRVVGDKILSSKITEKKIRLNSMNTSSLSSLDMCNSTDSSDFTKNCFKNSSISQYGLNNINKNTENFLSISKIFVNGNNQNMTFMTLPKTKLNFKLKKDQENSIFYKSNSSKIQTERGNFFI